MIVERAFIISYIFLGASEMLMAKAVSHFASKTPGKESVAITAFSNALQQVHTEK